MYLSEKEKQEIDFWKASEQERPESDSVENIVDKAADAAIFIDCLNLNNHVFQGAGRILEVGSGQGWASCIVKRFFPDAEVIATDISPHAVASVPKWERVFKTTVDDAYACRSYEIPEADDSVDCVFCFAAAHHFVAHRRTLLEIRRILAPGGHCFYFYEPSCQKIWYRLARYRVNRKRPEVPEDVLIYAKINHIAREVGLDCELQFYPSTRKRGAFETIYYTFLTHFRVLNYMFPCTINYHFSLPFISNE